MRWNVGVTVHPGKSYFEAEVAVYNPTPNTNTFLYWANVAAHTNDNFQTIFPPSVQLATFHSKTEFTHWPVSTTEYRGTNYGPEGTDISWWKNVERNASFFVHDLQEDFMGAYDHGTNTGTVHVGDHNIVKGAKLWEWGSGPRGQATEGRLTETSGPYVEIMVGAYSDNQPDYTWIRPYETKRWKQYWYPIKDIKGFKNANIDAAVNLEPRDGNKVFLGYYSTQKLERAQIILKNKDQIVLKKEVSISPENAFVEEVKLEGAYELTDLQTQLVDLETGKQIISYQPKVFEQPELPPVVKSPENPADIKTTEELYITGKRIEQFYNPLYSELDYFEEVLKRDPNDIRTNTAMGRKALLNGDYQSARKYLSTAINRITRDYTRPETCEAIYYQGLVLKAMGLYQEAIDTLYRASWDYAYHSASYFELAQISCMQGDFEKALIEIDESLSTNTKNNRAIALKASILRKLGKYDEAMEQLAGVSKIDPLNFRIANEQYLLAKETGCESTNSKLESLTKKMRGFDQNYLELAVGYLKEGMLDEADDVLQRRESSNPIVQYYKAYIQDKKGNSKAAKELFIKANALSEDYCFPYRLETVNVLNKALEYNGNDGKAYYYLGNIFYDKLPAKAIEYYHEAVKAEPELAMAWRNLGWGYYRHYKNYEKAISYYEKAVELNDQLAIFYAELDKLYELNNSPIETRLALFDGKNKVVRNRDDSFVHQTMVLTLAGQSDKAIEYLEGKTFSYREGTSRVREMIIDAHLSLGIKYFNSKNYPKALEEFLLAQVPEDEAGSARFGNREIQVNYFIAQAYEALGEKQKAKEFYVLSSDVEVAERVGVMNYYQGLSYLKLKEKAKANAIFDAMIQSGTKRLEDSEQTDFFAIFGEREAEGTRTSMAHTIRGLGYKGMGNNEKATKDLTKAVELSVSNLWATTELKGI
jgi:tetratricopeptide (TPR) repeat protein